MPHKLLLRLLLTLFSISLSAVAFGDIAEDDLPQDVQWYAHADLKEMEGSVTGKYLLDFLEKEVFSELRDETGIDLREDLEAVTVFGGQMKRKATVVLHGEFSEKSRSKTKALMEIYGDYEREVTKGVEVFSLTKRNAESVAEDDDQDELFMESRTTFIAFGKRKQTLITQDRSQLDAFIKEGGRVIRDKKQKQAGSLLVLKADRGLVKAGMNAGAGFAEKENWGSNILRQMEQIAVVLADKSGKAAVDLQLITSEPALAESVKNIIQGLISIKALDQDEDPQVQALLDSIKLELKGSTIQASMVMEPEMLREALN